ncbi:MAG TPA: TPM domain-containing protein [Prolixibacteraceae bacterium]|nr:TPM domain-containing protein [Prolixibacteraceae bacterium]
MRNILYKLDSLRVILIFALFLVAFGVNAADEFPARPEPQRLVNDFTGTLSSSQVTALENKLDAFNRRTSTQIAIVMVKDLYGYDTGDYAFQLAQNWGIGQKGKNNGILILVKPKTDNREKGKVFIAVGYGLEGVVPDITARKTIVSAEILPSFKVNDYYTGLDRATSVLMSLTEGEFTADQYDKKAAKSGALPGFAVLLLIFAVFMVFNRNKYRTVGADGSAGSLLGSLWFLSMLGGRGGGGSWNDFSGGGGGSSGGFGGFGGGGFGGGGAGGEW